MAKIIGIIEHVGAAGIGGSDVRGMGFYETSGTIERQYAPYDISGFGAVEPYDLSEPGRIAEVKRVLMALGQRFSDPAQNPTDPQLEDTFKFIDVSPAFLDAWDGPTADTYALTVGRHRDRFSALTPGERRTPLMQLPKFKDVHGQDVIVGGPQPTVAGLEALAQAAHEILKDSVQLPQYLAWRGGVLDCLSATLESCIPPDSVVTPTRRSGRAWNPRGWTVAWQTGPTAQANPDLLAKLSLIDQSLDAAWLYAPQEQNETARKARADALVDLRKQRHDIVMQLNQGAPPPECSDPSTIWSSSDGGCIPRCPPNKRWDVDEGICVIDIPEPAYKDYDTCMRELQKFGPEDQAEEACKTMFPGSKLAAATIVGIVAALGIGGYFLFRDKKIPVMEVPK